MSNYNNLMYGKGEVLGGGSTQIKCGTSINKITNTKLTARTSIIPLFKNFCDGELEVIKLKLPTLKMYPDNDTYVKDDIPFFSYYDRASLVQGNINNINFESFMTFNELNSLLPKIKEHVAKVKLVLINTDEKNHASIDLYEIDKTFKESNISYLSHPNKTYKIQSSVYNEQTKEYEFDLTNYLKSKYKENKNILGFGFSTDTNFTAGSFNSVNKPYIEIEYVPEDLFADTYEIPCKTKIRYASVITCKTNFYDEYPRIPCKTKFSKDSIHLSTKFKNVTKLECHTRFTFPPVTELIKLKTKFSKDRISINLPLGVNKEIPIKTKIVTNNNETKLATKTNIVPILTKKLNVGVLFGEKITLPCKTNIIPMNKISCKCKTLFSKDRINVNSKFIKVDKVDIPAKTKIITNGSHSITAKSKFSKDRINCRVNINLAISIPCTTKFSLYDSIPVKIKLNKPEKKNLDIKTKINFDSKINTKVKLNKLEATELVTKTNIILKDECRIDTSFIFSKEEVEMINLKSKFALKDESSIDAKFKFLKENNKSNINTKFKLINVNNNKQLNVRFVFLKEEVKYINAHIPYNVVAETKLPCKTKFIKENNKENLDCKLTLVKANVMSKIDTKLKLQIVETNQIETKLKLSLKGEDLKLNVKNLFLDADSKNIDTKTKVIVNDNSKMNIKFELDKPGSKFIRCKFKLNKEDESKLPTKTSIKFNADEKINTKTKIKFNDEQKLNAKTIFNKNGSTVLPSKVKLINLGNLGISTSTIFERNEDMNIDCKATLVLSREESLSIKTKFELDGCDNLIVIIQK